MVAATLPLLFSLPFGFPPRNPNPIPDARSRRLASTDSSHSVRCSSSPAPPPEVAPSLDLPLLPFQPGEVLIPSECKTLHLYEARFLALLEEALFRRKNSFVHFVLDPVVMSSPKSSFAARYGCLVQIKSVEKLEIGASVSIRGVCRVNITNILQMEPYLRGAIFPIKDSPRHNTEIDMRISELKESISNLHKLQMKLKVPKNELLQTNIRSSLLWAEKESFEDCDQAFIPDLAERFSFAAFQHVSGMSDAENYTLQKLKLEAMDLTDTVERLTNGIDYVKQNIRMIAARLAIQNL